MHGYVDGVSRRRAACCATAYPAIGPEPAGAVRPLRVGRRPKQAEVVQRRPVTTPVARTDAVNQSYTKESQGMRVVVDLLCAPLGREGLAGRKSATALRVSGSGAPAVAGSVMCIGGARRMWGDVSVSAIAAVGLLLVAGSAPATAAALPDGRAYEMVTPTDKDYGFQSECACSPTVAQAAPNGDSVAYETAGPLPGSAAGPYAGNWYLGTRRADGWATDPLAPAQDPSPTLAGQFPLFSAFSPDLSQAYVLTADPPQAPGATAGSSYLYERDNETNSYSLISGGDQLGSTDALMRYAGASSDGATVVYEAGNPQTADSPPSTGLGPGQYSELYERLGGQLRLVGPPSSTFTVAGAGAVDGHSVDHAVSNNGSRVFFSSRVSSPSLALSLFVRENDAIPVEVSASQRATPDPNGTQNVNFWGATDDGSRVFFTSSEELTNDANTGTNGSGSPDDAGTDLYSYDVDTGQLTDLTVDTNPADAGTGADVQGVVGTADDGSYVYVVALGDLGGVATSGSPNLYVLHNGTTTFIATLSTGDTNDWSPQILQRTSRVTPTGEQIVFTSVNSLTGYDNGDSSTGSPDAEIFRYDASSGQLSCVSCNPTGAQPIGAATIAPVGDVTQLTHLPRNISDSGVRVFFTSADALIPADTNGQQDVYEWELEGSGSCQSSADAGGCIYLISSGSGSGAWFSDASASGDDVFFGSRDQLLPEDQDVLADLYDARVDGGLPEPPATPAPCTRDDCHGTSPSPPAPPTVGSVTFTGPGNQTPAPVPGGSHSPAGKPPAPVKATGAGKVRVTSKAVKGTRFTLSVKVPGRGRLAITGGEVRKITRSIPKEGTYELTVTLTAKAKRKLKQIRKLEPVLRVTYFPVSGTASHAIVRLTVKPVRRPSKKGRRSSQDHGGAR